MARFRYHVLQHEESYELKADGPTAPGTIDQPYVSDPKWAVKNAARNRAQRLSRGYYGPKDRRRVLRAKRVGCFARGLPEGALPRLRRPCAARARWACASGRYACAGTSSTSSAQSGSTQRRISRDGSNSSTWTARSHAGPSAWTSATSRSPAAHCGCPSAGSSRCGPRGRIPPNAPRGSSRITYTGFEEVPPH